MTEKYKKLNDTFNIKSEMISSDSSEIESKNIKIEKVEGVPVEIEDIKKDYEYTRGNLYSIIEKGQEAINGILELAQETEMPRAYEVAGQLIKNVADATDKLMDLQKKLKDIEENNLKGPTTVNNALFVGSTAELAKLLKQNNFTNQSE